MIEALNIEAFELIKLVSHKPKKIPMERVELTGLSHKGLEFITSIEEIYVNEDFKWTHVVHENEKQFVKVKVAKVSIIDFDDIVDYDLKGDEHYMKPSIVSFDI